MWRHVLGLLLLALSVGARADLHEVDTIDAVVINKATGEVRLFLAINWPLEDGQTTRQVRQKMAFYSQAVKSESFAKRYPNAKTGLPIQLQIFHVQKRSPLGESVLSQIEARAKELGFVPVFVVADDPAKK